MIDILALAISHGLLALAVWRLMWREDLYHDNGAPPRRRPGMGAVLRGPVDGDAGPNAGPNAGKDPAREGAGRD